MTSIQIGMSKSGNLWFYNIMEQIYAAKGMPFKSFIRTHPDLSKFEAANLAFPKQPDIDHMSISHDSAVYRTGVGFCNEITDMRSYLDQVSHVWMHTPWCSRSANVLPLFDKTIYLLRDPRDIAISLSHYAFTPYRMKNFRHEEKTPVDFLEKHLHFTISRWVDHVTGYLRRRRELNLHVIFYERLLNDFNNTLRDLLKYLNISLSEDQIDQIRHKLSFETMRSSHPNHLRKGIAGDWTEKLSVDQIKRVSLLAAPLLRNLGYPVKREDALVWEKLRVGPELNGLRMAYIEKRASFFRKCISAKKKMGAYFPASEE